MEEILPEIKEFLEEKVIQYNRPAFIETDPIFVPHQYIQKEDIEIAAFLSATLAWGKRELIIRSALRLLSLMDNAPFDFVVNHGPNDLKRLESFVHRTYNGRDAVFFVKALRHIYKHHGGLEAVFTKHAGKTSVTPAIQHLNCVFFSIPHEERSLKHLANPAKGSAAKRINMFLRWMVRHDNKGVDFGLWRSISPAALSCPLDYHSGNVARKFGLLTRKTNDLKAVMELDAVLRSMDSEDPVKYDFALFGLGVFESEK